MCNIPKINLFLKPSGNSEQSQIVLIFYKCLHIFLGLDFGFLSVGKFNCLFKRIIQLPSLIVCVTNVIWAYYFSFFGMDTFIYYLHTTEHMINVLILFGMKTNLYEYLCVMRNIDAQTNVANKSFFDEARVTTLLAIFLTFFKTCMTVTVWGFVREIKNSIWVIASLHVMWLSHDFVCIASSLLFLASYRRLKTLSYLLEATDPQYVALNDTYKCIINATEYIKSSFDPLILSVLLYNIPEVMYYIYGLVANVKLQIISVGSFDSIFSTITAVITLIETAAPALFAGVLTAQANKIKVILHDKMMKSRQDATKMEDIQIFIQYVEARPMRFYVYQVVPLNADLLGIIFNFCITYLIVIIQFAHLY